MDNNTLKSKVISQSFFVVVLNSKFKSVPRTSTIQKKNKK